MILPVAFALALGQASCDPYTRTQVDDSDPTSNSLYWREDTQVEWRINDKGNPETTGDTEFTAVEQSLATWQTELDACGSLALKIGPRTSSRLAFYDKTNTTENQNVVLWRFKRCVASTDAGTMFEQPVNPTDVCWHDDDCGNKYDCWQHNKQALAITTTNFNPASGRIVDADVELNTPTFIFTTVDGPPCIQPNYHQGCVATDVKNTMTHEFGHSLGLAHNTCQSSSTMFASATPAELSKRTLDVGSKQFICETYPKGKPSRAGIVKSFDGNLGGAAGCGCGAGAAGGAIWAGLALLGLRRRFGSGRPLP